MNKPMTVAVSFAAIIWLAARTMNRMQKAVKRYDETHRENFEATRLPPL